MKQSQNSHGIIVWMLLTFLTLTLAGPITAETDKIPQRSDIENKYKWKTEDIYLDVDNWNKDYEAVETNLPRYDAFKGHLGDSPQKLLECLKLEDSLSLIIDNLYVYAYLKLDEDNREGSYQELTGRVSGLASRKSGATAYIEPEILALSKEKIDEFIAAEKGLEVYAFHLSDMFRTNEHTLSDKEEKILALAGSITRNPGNIFSMLNDADITYGSIIDEEGNDVELTKGRAYKFMESTDRRVRRDARTAYNNAYVKIENSLAACLAGSVKTDNFKKEARGYNSCLEMSLDRYNIPTSVFHNIIDAVNANLTPLHKWTSIRKKILGYDTLHPYDLGAPLIPEMKKEYSYEQAMEMIVEGLEPMGKKYVADLKTGFESGWVDVYETQGKGSGAYSWGTYSSHPYVLMNYSGTLEDVFTLAHEMGHALHSFYTNQNEAYINENHSLFVAEVASTCNEAILLKYLLQNTNDKKEKMYLLNYYIDQIKGTFYTQVMFSEFEIAIHEKVETGGALSADWLRQTYRDIYQKYWGPELVLGENDDYGGMRISHFYRQYYVYQYATSYAAAQLISQKIIEGDKEALDAYLNFLATGNSDYPVEILKKAGVDTTSPESVERTIKIFSDLVDQMEQLLNES